MAVPEALRARLRGMARSDVEALIEEARAEARAEVKTVLRDVYVEELLDTVAEHEQHEALADAGEAEHEGLWVYCVVPVGRVLPPGTTGVAGAALTLVESGGVAAVVGAVPLREYGEEPLREHLNDLAWLERTVRAHERVLDAMLADGAIVPMRICTIYRDAEQVGAMLEGREPLLRETLARLAGKAEWGVKIVVERPRLEDHARSLMAEAEESGGSEGVAYVARKKLAAQVRTEADRILDSVLRETHARLEEWSAGSVVLPAQNRELAGYDGDMVFNAAYLLEDERIHTFRGLFEELGAQYGQMGFAFELTGPWPAYNFAAGGEQE